MTVAKLLENTLEAARFAITPRPWSLRFLKPTLLKGMIKSMVQQSLPAQMQDWDARFKALGLF